MSPNLTEPGRDSLLQRATQITMYAEDQPDETDPLQGEEGVDWHWVRGEKFPLRMNSFEAVRAGLQGVTRGRD